MARASKPNIPSKATGSDHYAAELNAVDTAIDNIIDDYTSLTDTGNQAIASLVHIGRRASDPNTSGWGEDEKGLMWHNKTEGKYKYWNGVATLSFPVTGGSGAPTDASYVTINAEAGLDAEVQHANIADEAQKHTPKIHALGSDRHSADTLANLNTRVSDATLVDEGHTHTESDITDLDHDDTDAIHDNVSGEIATVAEKGAPVAADLILIEDSAAANAKKRVQLGQLPTGDDPNAIHDDESGEIAAIAEKVAPVSADLLLIEDSAAANVKKKVQMGNLPGGGTYKLAPSYTIYKVENYYYAMDADGNVDYSGTSLRLVIQAAHDALTSGGLIYLKKFSYTESTSVPILTVTNSYIRVTGNYPTLTIGNGVATANAHAIIKVEASNVEIDHLILNGNGANQSYSATWLSEEAVLDVWKYRWNSASLKTASWIEDVYIHDCLIQNSYHVGIAANKVRRIKILNNHIKYTTSASNAKNIHVAWCEDSEIAHNICDIYASFIASSNNIMIFKGGLWTDVYNGSQRVDVHHNFCLHSKDAPIEAQGGYEANQEHVGINIHHNTVWGTAIIFSDNVRNSTINNNIVLMDSTGFSYGIRLFNHDSSTANTLLARIVVANNIVTSIGGDTSDRGIQLQCYGLGKIDHIVIEGNYVNNMVGYGISVEGENLAGGIGRVVISNNKIHDCDTYGIVTMQTPSTSVFIVKGNEIFDCGTTGIIISGEADYGTIIGNRVQCATGLSLSATSDNWFVDGNDFYGCTTDVSDSSGGTTVYGGNRDQAGTYDHQAEP